ncbi:TPA: RNA-directed DNA polymerase, partial [Escherichia coli]|nr:RNA-directed DNA polymerase [Escherichia coli]
SIRYPRKVANSFFLYENNALEKYKGEDIETTKDELMRKYSSSYFSYGGFNRIYKLFQSKMFIELEKRFSVMWMLDVSHCFDSIYTHSVSWALKNKSYIKKHVKHSNQFGQELDTLMQRSNNNETNGIPIGSEFSRVFAELIFQRIDCNIESCLLSEHG